MESGIRLGSLSLVLSVLLFSGQSFAAAIPVFDAKTSLWGVDRVQLSKVQGVLRRELGRDLIDAYAFGSRVKGRSYASGGPVSERSDLDVLLHLRNTMDSSRNVEKARALLEGMFAFPVSLHFVKSADDGRMKDAVAYGFGPVAKELAIVLPGEPTPRGADVALRLPRPRRR